MARNPRGFFNFFNQTSQRVTRTAQLVFEGIPPDEDSSSDKAAPVPPTDPKRQFVLPELIERESVIPRTLHSRENVIIFYGNCCSPIGFGDHTFCLSLAYQIYRAQTAPYPIVFLSGSDGIARFNTLCQIPGADQKKMYDVPVAIHSIETLDSTSFFIRGYVEVGCKNNHTKYVNRVMLRDGAKAAIVGRPVDGSQFRNHYMSSRQPDCNSNNTKGFLMGFGVDRDGISHIPFALISPRIPREELTMTRLPESLIASHPGHGLLCVSQGKLHIEDVDYTSKYMKFFCQMSQNNLIIALGDERIISGAVANFSRTTGKRVLFVDYPNNRITEFPGGTLSATPDVNTVNPDDQPDVLYVVMSREIPQVQLRRLIVNAGLLVGLTSATLAIAGLGEGKLVLYQCLKDGKIFLENYLSIMRNRLDDQRLEKFVSLLFSAVRLTNKDAQELEIFLADRDACAQVTAHNQSLIAEESGRLAVGLLNWLGLPAARPGRATSVAQPTTARLFQLARTIPRRIITNDKQLECAGNQVKRTK